MAVKDSTTTRIKAADARRAMKQGPYKGTLSLDLCQKFPMQAVGITYFGSSGAFSGAGRHQTINQAAAEAEDDRSVLYDWVRNTAERAPEEVKAKVGAVIWAIGTDGIAEVATWGKDAAACDVIAKWAHETMEALPACPWATYFGWGNGGIPKPLSTAEFASLTPNQQDYVRRYTR